jgi:ribosomal protein S18 acetylase RimI-like enzyme
MPAFTLTTPLLKQSALCVPILRALPDWFGIEAALLNYQREIDHLPTLVARVGEQPAGFLTVKQHFAHSAELYGMGVLPEFQRLGIGRALVKGAEKFLRAQGVHYFQVKTLGPSHDDPGYAATRAFYQACGFSSLEEFPQIWDENNPCLIMVRWIGLENQSF